MSKNSIRESFITKLLEPPKSSSYPFPRKMPSTEKGKTLADFYTEVLQSSKPIYDTKSAKELEIMMIQNRRLIEAKNKKR